MIWRQTICATRRFLVGLAAASLVGALGCSAGDRPASVSGRVTYNGKTVTSGVVVLIGEDGKASDPGAVQPDGTYSIAKSPIGTVKVSFDNPPPPESRTSSGGKLPANDPEAKENAEAAARYVATPPKYKDPAQSGLTLEIKKGKNSGMDIELR